MCNPLPAPGNLAGQHTEQPAAGLWSFIRARVAVQAHPATVRRAIIDNRASAEPRVQVHHHQSVRLADLAMVHYIYSNIICR